MRCSKIMLLLTMGGAVGAAFWGSQRAAAAEALVLPAKSQVYQTATFDAPTTKYLKAKTKWTVTNERFDTDGTWYNLGGSQWVYVPKKPQTTLKLKAQATIYSGFGPTAQATGRKLPKNSTWKISQTAVVAKTTWYNLGGGQWVTEAAGYNAKTSGQSVKTLKLPFSAPVFNNYGMHRQAAGRTLAAGSSWAVQGTASEYGITWYNLGGSQWVTLDSAIDNVSGQTMRFAKPVWLYRGYGQGRIAAGQSVPAHHSIAIKADVKVGSTVWYQTTAGLWFSADKAVNHAPELTPVVLRQAVYKRSQPAGSVLGNWPKGQRLQAVASREYLGRKWYALANGSWFAQDDAAEDSQTQAANAQGQIDASQSEPGQTPNRQAADAGDTHFSLPILMYHDFESDQPTNAWEVPAQQFANEMQWLKADGYHFLTPEEALTALQTGQLPDVKSVWVTMDDGYARWMTAVLPVLQNLGIHVTGFEISGASGQSWNLAPADLLALQAAGMAVESHTVSHVNLKVFSAQEQYAEMAAAKAALEKLTGRSINSIAYPYGDVDTLISEAAAAAGYQMALDVNGGIATGSNGQFRLSRIHVLPGLDQTQFMALLH